MQFYLMAKLIEPLKVFAFASKHGVLRARLSMRRHPGLSIIGSIVGVSVVLTIVLTVSILDAIKFADNLRDASDRIIDSSMSADSKSFVRISTELDSLIEDAEQTRDQMWHVRWIGAGLGFVPVLGDSSSAVLNMMDRTVLDLKATMHLLDSALLLSVLIDEASTQAGEGLSPWSSFPSRDAIENASTDLYEASEFLLESERLWLEMKEYSTQFGRLKNADVAIRNRELWVKDLLDWSFRATDSLKKMSGLGDIFEPFANLLENPDRDLIRSLETAKTIPEATIAVSEIAASLQDIVATAPGAIRSSSFWDDLAELNVIVGSADSILTALNHLLTAMSATLDEVIAVDDGIFGEKGGGLQGLRVMKLHHGELEEAEDLLKSSRVLAETRFSRASLSSISDLLQSVSHSALQTTVMFRELGNVAEMLLGGDEPKTFLVLGANADELRASGGFVFGVWSIEVHNGRLESTVYHDIVALDDWGNLASYPTSPPLLRAHMDAPIILMRDVLWPSEFRYAAELVEEIWRLGGNDRPVDGVISMSQWALVELVSDIGTIDVLGEPIAGPEIMKLLEVGTDKQGRQFADLVFKAVEMELTEEMSRAQVLRFFDTLTSLLAQKNIMVHLLDSEANEAVVRAGWASSISTKTGDRLAVVDSNIGWNKVDRNISRSVRYIVDLEDIDAPKVRIELKYHNASTGVADGCATQLKVDSATYSEFTNGCYWNLFRVYVASGANLITGEVLPLPANSVYHLLGLGSPGDNTLEMGIDGSGDFVSGILAIPPDETRSVFIELDLPLSVVEYDAGSLRYSLTLFAQPGANGRATVVEIEIPTGFRFRTGLPTPDNPSGETLTYSFDLLEDSTLVLELDPN